MALYDRSRQLVASTGAPLPRPTGEMTAAGATARGGPAWTVALPDGRWLVVALVAGRRNPVLGLVVFLAVIAVAVGVSAFPSRAG